MSDHVQPHRLARLALFAAVVCVPLVPLLPVPGADLALKQLVVLALGAVAAALLWRLAVIGDKGPVLATPLDALVLGWLGVTGLAAALAPDPLVGAYAFGGRMALGVIYVLAVKSLRTPSHVRLMYMGVLATALIIAALGLSGYSRFLADGAPEQARAGYLSTPLFPHSYLAAQYLVPVLAGALVLVAGKTLTGQVRAAVITALIPIGAFVFVVGSRGAILAVAGALVVSSALGIVASGEGGRRRRLIALTWRAALIASAVVALAFALSLAGVLEADYAADRLAMLFDPSRSSFNYSRLDVWRHSLDMVADQVLFGVGPGHFESVFPAYHASAAAIPHAHNQFVHVLAESGVAGLAAFLLLLRQARRAVVRGAGHNANDEERRGLYHAAVAALIAGLICFMWETPLLWIESGGLLLLLLAIISRTGCTRQPEPTPPLTAHASLVGLGLLIALTGTASWRYLAATRYGEEAAEAMARAAATDDPASAHSEQLTALHMLNAAENAFPHGGDLLAIKAWLLASMGREAEALDVWRQIDARVPGAFRSLSAIGTLELRLSRPDAAIDPLRRAVIAHQGSESAATYARLAQAYLRAGRLEEAWTSYQVLIATLHYQVEQPAILLDAARALVRLGRHPQFARRFLELYAELMPEDTANPRVAELVEKLDEIVNAPPRTNGDTAGS